MPNPSVKNYSFTVVNGEVYYRQNSVMVQAADDFGRPFPQDNYYLCMPDGTCATYIFEVPDNYTMYGVPEVHLRLATPDADKEAMLVTAALIDTIDGETGFKAYLTKERLLTLWLFMLMHDYDLRNRPW